MSQEVHSKLRDAFLRKLRTDGLEVLESAKNEGKLADIIQEDIKRLKLDLSKISKDDLLSAYGAATGKKSESNQPANSSNSSSAPPRNVTRNQSNRSLPDLFDTISHFADEKFYGPLFEKQADSFEKAVSGQMTDLGAFRKIEDALKTTKVSALLASPLLAMASIRNANSSRIIIAVIYGVLALDCLRISYNCYIKNYVSRAMRRLGADGDPAKIGATFMQWASAAIGISKGDDPFKKVQREVMWDIVYDNCLTMVVYRMVRYV